MKDPAFLFYSNDFLTGVADLTMEERGQYITLLCLQHQKGPLSEKTIWLSVGNVSVDVLNKFETNTNGFFINKRLQEEIDKRSIFIESRRKNGEKGGRPSKNNHKDNLMDNHKDNLNKSEREPYGFAYANHMGNLPENENENENSLLEIENRKDRGYGGKKNNLPHHTEIHNPVNGQFTKTKTNVVKELVPHPNDDAGKVQYEIVAMSNGWSYDKLITVWEAWCASRESNEEKRFNRTEALADFRKFAMSWRVNEQAKKVKPAPERKKIVYEEP